MQAIDLVYDLLLDEGEIELVENDALPVVVNQRNPFYLHIEYNEQEKRFECQTKYKCRDIEDQFVQINRMYTTEMIGELALLYDQELDDFGNVVDNG